MLGLSISATNDRIRKLKKYGIIKRIAAFVDASFLGKGTAAFISFNLNASSAEDELANLYEHENVSEIHNISGRYAHKIKVRFNNVHALNEFLMSYIKTKMKVTDYSLEVVLSSSKEESVIVGQ
jgi:DNA-binding Lrp family transcriptional regulator